jgi:hypothetical protein
MATLFESLAAICKPQTTTISGDVVILSNAVDKSTIYTGNLTPEQVATINDCDEIIARSGYVIGLKGGQIKFETSAAYWNDCDIKDNLPYFSDPTRTTPHWELNKF